MFHISCIDQHRDNVAAVDARVNMHSALAMPFVWTTTKPYGDQRLSGAPPG